MKFSSSALLPILLAATGAIAADPSTRKEPAAPQHGSLRKSNNAAAADGRKLWASDSSWPDYEPRPQQSGHQQQYGPPEYEPTHYEPTHYGPPQHEPPYYEPPQHGPPYYEPPQHEPTHYGPPQHGPPQHEPPYYEPPQHGPPQHEPPYYEPPHYEQQCYSCDWYSNPCQDAAWKGQFYFAHCDSKKYVQCDANGGCFEQPCGHGTVWDQHANTCVHDTHKKNKGHHNKGGHHGKQHGQNDWNDYNDYGW